MSFWIFLFLFTCNSLIPVMMIVFGRVMWKHPPKKINGIYGYRTDMSMKNRDTWKFAHEFSGRLWWKTGWIMLLLSVLIQLLFLKSSETAISILSLVLCFLQIAVLIYTIIPTEKALKKNFDSNGNRQRDIS